MNLFFAAWLILFSFVFSSVDAVAGYVVKKNSISIICPQSLNSTYDAAIGYFGVPDDGDQIHGGSIEGTLVYPQKGSKGCFPFNSDELFEHKTSLPTILLLDRGACYLALKVWNAQQAGAVAVLIADDSYEPLYTASFSNEFSKKIMILSALIQRSLGDTLKNALLNKGQDDVVIKLDWSETKDGDTSSDCSNLANLINRMTIQQEPIEDPLFP